MEKDKTIRGVVKDDLCHGCGTCVSLCPNSAIDLSISRRGLYIPEINTPKCSRCGICYEVCPGHSVSFSALTRKALDADYQTLIGHFIKCYTGYSSENSLRFKSTSGGVVTSILNYALDQGLIDGAVVTRMRKEKPLEPETFIARTKAEILESIGSKYCPVPANLALRDVMKTEGRLAYVGLPCHLHGLRKAEMINQKLRDRIVLRIGLFCGYNKTFEGTAYLLDRNDIQQNDVQSIRYRGDGWPGNLTIILKNNKKLVKPVTQYYDGRFCAFVSWRCKTCPDQTAELADISCGDAWLPEILKNDNIGTSVIVTRNPAADGLIRTIADKQQIIIAETSPQKVYQSQVGDKTGKGKNTSTFFKLSGLLMKKRPTYDLVLPPVNLRSIMVNSLWYTQGLLASRRYLWWMLDVLCTILELRVKFKTTKPISRE